TAPALPPPTMTFSGNNRRFLLAAEVRALSPAAAQHTAEPASGNLQYESNRPDQVEHPTEDQRGDKQAECGDQADQPALQLHFPCDCAGDPKRSAKRQQRRQRRSYPWADLADKLGEQGVIRLAMGLDDEAHVVEDDDQKDQQHAECGCRDAGQQNVGQARRPKLSTHGHYLVWPDRSQMRVNRARRPFALHHAGRIEHDACIWPALSDYIVRRRPAWQSEREPAELWGNERQQWG